MKLSLEKDNLSAWERYKAHSQNDAGITKLKAQVAAATLQRLSAAMNDTKWLELQQAVAALPFPPAYVVKLLTEDGVPTLDHAPTYWGNWGLYYEEGLPPFFNIEWMQVAPRYSKHRGSLVADEVIDASAAFEAVLQRYGIPYEEENGIFTIYGYR